MRTSVGSWSCVGLALALAGCRGGSGAFQCQVSTECVDEVQGTCEPDGFCSFPDPSCASGRRYGDFAGGGKGGTCVGGEGGDARVADADPACAGVFPYDPTNLDCAALPAAGPTIDLPAGDSTIDTDTATLYPANGDPVALASIPMAQPDGPTLLVVVTDQLIAPAGATLTITGARPLALVAFTSATIDGTITVAASGTAAGGGAGDPATCGAGVGGPGGEQTDETTGNTGGAGGGGGGFGGDGGRGARVAGSSAAATDGGGAGGNAVLAPLRGGCAGGPGGGAGGAGGGGGGAFQLTVGGALHVGSDGLITAGGGGGESGQGGSAGAGGGGSGGAILLEAGAIVVDGTVTAHGGGGGEGTRSGPSAAPGEDGHATDADPALGGAGQSSGGDGGAGAASTPVEDGLEGVAGDFIACGGGGGGGGLGRIRIHSVSAPANITGLISPPPS